MKDYTPQLRVDSTINEAAPSISVDSSGIIRKISGSQLEPYFTPGTNLKDMIPGVIWEDVIKDATQLNAAVNDREYLITSYPDSSQDGATLVFEDIVLLSQRLHSYQQEIDVFKMILDSPYEGMIYINTEGTIKYVNDSLAHYNKLPREEIMGKKHRSFRIDGCLDQTLKTKEFEPFVFLTAPGHKKMIASRRPLFDKYGELAGAFGRYLSIDPKDVDKYGEDYIDLIARLETKDIMVNVNQSILELNSYKDEFHKMNTAKLGVENIIGNTPEMKELKKRVMIVSESPSSVLLSGESGTGKELFAKAIHFHGRRSAQPLVKVNCAAIPENLLEAELFGYVDGAFTGARKGGKMGKFELANKGTIFLDEIGDMPLSMQAKLLRVLQENEVERIGSETSIPVDVRVISATNKNLQAMVRDNTFREDLYYRLNVVNLHIPPLRDRMADVPHLVSYIIDFLNGRLDRAVLYPTQEALDLMMGYEWPGNIRELINVLETAMNFCGSSVIDTNDLPYFLHTISPKESNLDRLQSLEAQKDQTEKGQLVSALKQCNGNRKATAEMLAISKVTLWRLMKKHELL